MRKAVNFVEPTRAEQGNAELILLRRQLFLADVLEAEAEYEAGGGHRFDDVEGLLDDLTHEGRP